MKSDGFGCAYGVVLVCDSCEAGSYAETYKGPRQCPKCGSRGWNDGMVRGADLYARSLRWVVLNPYRKPLSVKQQDSLRQVVAARRAATTPKATGLRADPSQSCLAPPGDAPGVGGRSFARLGPSAKFLIFIFYF
jgi:hypothetical protein